MNTFTQANTKVNSNPFTNDFYIEETISWSQTDIQELKHGMLTLALEEVRDNRKSKKMKREAWDWLMSDENSAHSFSVESCCAELGMDVVNLRSMLNQFLETGVIRL